MNIKIVKTEARVDIRYLQKKGITPKYIHDDMLQIFAEDTPSYTTVTKLAAGFLSMVQDSTENDPRSSGSKTSTTKI